MSRLRMPRPTYTLLAACAFLLLAGCGDDASDGSVSLMSPSDGDSVAGSVELVMAADGVTIEEAGEVNDGAGHFHVIADQGCLDAATPIGNDADHVHFGGGQSDGVIYLGPGDHELCLQVGDGGHAALDITDTISLNVDITSQDEWCSVMDELDQLIESLDLSEEEFAAQQIGWENSGRLAAQLLDGIDQVVADAVDDVAGALALASDMASAVTEAKDADSARASVDAAFEAAIDLDEIPGQTWIEDTCGIDLGS